MDPLVKTTDALYIQLTRRKDRGGWQKTVGYRRRSLVEMAMFRYKTLIGPTLRAQKFEVQQVEAQIACAVINRMTQLGMPVSQRIA